jgi:hypothetical protein
MMPLRAIVLKISYIFPLKKRKSVFNNLDLVIYLNDKRMQLAIFVATASYDM